jgi:hypothetical protein
MTTDGLTARRATGVGVAVADRSHRDPDDDASGNAPDFSAVDSDSH